jgi:hypothetical protein
LLLLEKEITVLTAQGVGDIFWVYQKLSPHFDRINIIIATTGRWGGMQRAIPFAYTLPKVNDASFKLITIKEYKDIMNNCGKKYMKNLIHENEIKKESPLKAANGCTYNYVKYSVNKWLEAGIRIDEIDDFKIEENVDILCEPIEIPDREYIILYISGGHTKKGRWKPNRYAHLIKNTYERYNVNYPIVLLGATYDKNNLMAAGNKLKEFGYEVHTAINHKFENANYIIKNSSYFIGYQSGLNIIADNFDIPQTMMYFNHFGNLMHSWPKKRNLEGEIRNRTYNAIKFNEHIEYCKNFELLLGGASYPLISH